MFFLRLVGGMETLNSMERVETDDKDRPKVVYYIARFNLHVFTLLKNVHAYSGFP